MTTRAFTIVACRGCGPGGNLPVLEMLGEAVRCCRHGVLVSTTCCPLPHACGGRAGDAAARAGMSVFVQPCTPGDRSPSGPAVRLGPIATMADLLDLCAWIVQDEGHGSPPPHLLGRTDRPAPYLN